MHAIPLGARVARWIRLFHFRVTPLLAALTAVCAIGLLCSPHWRWPLVVGVGFMLPPAFLLWRSQSLRADGPRRQLVFAGGRLLGLLWISLLAINAPRSQPSPRRIEAPAEACTLEIPPPAGFAAVDPEVGS